MEPHPPRDPSTRDPSSRDPTLTSYYRYHEAWHPVAKRTMGVPWSQWLSANNGYCFALNGGGGTPSRTGWYNELESRSSLRASNAKLQSLPSL
jgi:hypothetical protein